MLVCKEHDKWEWNKSLIHLWNSYLSLSVNSVQSSQQKRDHCVNTIYTDTSYCILRSCLSSHIHCLLLIFSKTWYCTNLGCSQREKSVDPEKDRLIAFWLRDQGKGKPPVNDGPFGARLGGMPLGPLLLLSYSVLATTLWSRIYHSLFTDEEAWKKLTN